MLSLHRATLCVVYLLLSPLSTEGLFFRALFCRLFRRGCKAPIKPPTKAPVKPPLANDPIINVPVAPLPLVPAPVAPTPVAKAPVANAPVALAPVTKVPSTKSPVTKEPVGKEAPVMKAPVANDPAAPLDKAPTLAPLKPPTIAAPVKAPTLAPIKAPTLAPIKAPTRAPSKPPTRAPVKPPTRAPLAALPASDFYFNDDEDEDFHYIPSGLNDFTVCIKVTNSRTLSNVTADHAAVFGKTVPNVTVEALANRLCVTALTRNLVDGPNMLQITAKETTGNMFTVTDDIWLAWDTSAITAAPYNGVVQLDTVVYVNVADDPEVQERRFVYLPDGFTDDFPTPLNRLLFVAGYIAKGGLSRAIPVFLTTSFSLLLALPLYGPSVPSTVANSDLRQGTTNGWNLEPSIAEMGIVKHVENPSPKRSLRELQVDNDIYVCTSKSIPTVRMFRSVQVFTGTSTAEVRFRFSTNDVNNRHGYHVWLLAMDGNDKGYESLVVGSGSGLVRNGDPFNLVDVPAGNLTSSKWMTHTLGLRTGTVSAELMVTVHSQPDSSQPSLRSCVTVDYLSVY